MNETAGQAASRWVRNCEAGLRHRCGQPRSPRIPIGPQKRPSRRPASTGRTKPMIPQPGPRRTFQDRGRARYVLAQQQCIERFSSADGPTRPTQAVSLGAHDLELAPSLPRQNEPKCPRKYRPWIRFNHTENRSARSPAHWSYNRNISPPRSAGVIPLCTRAGPPPSPAAAPGRNRETADNARLVSPSQADARPESVCAAPQGPHRHAGPANTVRGHHRGLAPRADFPARKGPASGLRKEASCNLPAR